MDIGVLVLFVGFLVNCFVLVLVRGICFCSFGLGFWGLVCSFGYFVWVFCLFWGFVCLLVG